MHPFKVYHLALLLLTCCTDSCSAGAGPAWLTAIVSSVAMGADWSASTVTFSKPGIDASCHMRKRRKHNIDHSLNKVFLQFDWL